MKRRLLILSILAISIVTLSAVGGVAYFNSKSNADNIITSGAIDIEIVEKTESSNGTLIAFPKEGLTGVMPGTDASKIVSVKNIGSAEAWVRLKMDISITSSEGKTLPDYLNINNKNIPVVCPNIKDGWQIESDGYYYCLKPVAANASSSNFLETVSFAKEMGNEYQDCTVKLVISAQAVQTAHNPENRSQYGNSAVMKANGWPT